jgi:hypothetical protein
LNATTAIEIAVYGGVIPAVAAMAAFFAIGRLWPGHAAGRYQVGLSFALAVYVGFVSLRSTKTLLPSQFWQWIPILGLFAAFVTGLTRASGVLRSERWLAVYVFAVVSAWLLVPHWPELMPAWPVQVAMVATSFIALAALLMPLVERLPGRAFPFWLMFAAATTSCLVMAEVSETFGELAALPAGALAGCGLAALMRRDDEIDWRGIALPYAVVVGGWAYVGAIYPTTPIWPLIAAPAAPLALWLCVSRPVARLRGAAGLAVQAACVLIPLLIVAVLLLAGSSGGADNW